MEVLSLFESYCEGCSKCEVEISHDKAIAAQNGFVHNTIKVYCKHMDLCEKVARELEGRMMSNGYRETL